MDSIYLFEHKYTKQDSSILSKLEKNFESFLDDIWKNRPISEYQFWNDDKEEDISEEQESNKGKQRFLQFRKEELAPRNYVGIIKYKDTEIHLLPKIFYDKDIHKILNEDSGDKNNVNKEFINSIHLHILYWLSYTDRVSFPKSLSSLGDISINNFFEILILMFATYTRETLNKILYQNYHERSDDINYVKGRLDVRGYINNNLITGNKQRLTCIYDSFELDNRFNRIIKHVSKMLINYTDNPESKKLLQEICFILDDVSDMSMTYYDCNKVNLNPFYKDLNSVLDYCKLFLANSMIYKSEDQFEVFAFLLPMERIFEEFVFGFLKKYIPTGENKKVIFENNWFINYQKPENHLTIKKVNSKDYKYFKMKPDIHLESKHGHRNNIMIDTKYKVLSGNRKRWYKSIHQPDMYQMVSYAIRYDIDKIVLLYPDSHSNGIEEDLFTEFPIKDKLNNNNHHINIRIYKLPLLCYNEGEKVIKDYSKLRKIIDGNVYTSLCNILLWKN